MPLLRCITVAANAVDGNGSKNINSVLTIIGKGVAEWLLHSRLSTDLNGERL